MIETNRMVAVYVGCGHDTRPIMQFPQVRKFHYIDSCSSESEIGRVDVAMSSTGLNLVSTHGDIRMYKNETQTVVFHTNTSLPEHLERIKPHIQGFDTLIVSGHNTNYSVLEATARLVTWIGLPATNHVPHSDGIINRLHRDECLQKKFISFIVLWRNGVKQNFPTWREYSSAMRCINT